MPLDAKSFQITLTDTEANELLSVSGGSPAQQQVQQALRDQLTDGNRTVTLTDPQIGKLVRFMATGPTAVKQVLRRAFARPLVEVITKG